MHAHVAVAAPAHRFEDRGGATGRLVLGEDVIELIPPAA